MDFFKAAELGMVLLESAPGFNGSLLMAGPYIGFKIQDQLVTIVQSDVMDGFYNVHVSNDPLQMELSDPTLAFVDWDNVIEYLLENVPIWAKPAAVTPVSSFPFAFSEN